MIIRGDIVAEKVLNELKTKIASIEKNRKPKLGYILIGDNPASHLYVKYKVLDCEKVGIDVAGYNLDKEIDQESVLKIVQNLNQDPTVDGILIQLPLPVHLDAQTVLEAVDPKKDVDGFHPYNFGKLLLGYEPNFVPCTPLGVQTLLKHYQIETRSKHIVIMGRSNIVGKPLAALLMQKQDHANATVSLVHSYTQNLEEITKQADILIAAMGAPRFVGPNMVKKGATIIDVGISKFRGKMVGDVQFDEVMPLCSFITPVPKGVGPMTRAMLLSNIVKSFSKD